MLEGIEFRETKQISLQEVLSLFRREQWRDLMDIEEVEFYLQVALYIVSAWQGSELIGFARLEGDGRISVEISDVLVRSDFQGQGIGTDLVRRLVDHIRRLDPYYIQVEPIGDREVHIYSKFGFREGKGCRMMQLESPKLTRKLAEVRGHREGT